MPKRYHAWRPPGTPVDVSRHAPVATTAIVCHQGLTYLPEQLESGRQRSVLFGSPSALADAISRACGATSTQSSPRPIGQGTWECGRISPPVLRTESGSYNDSVAAGGYDTDFEPVPESDGEEPTDGDSAQFDNESGASEPENALSPERARLVAKAIAILIAERQRSDEPLRQESVERTYAQLKLTPSEMLLVAEEARATGLMETEQGDKLEELTDRLEEDDEEPVSRSNLLDRILSHDLLGAERERQLGRAVQVARRLEAEFDLSAATPKPELEREINRGRHARHALVLANARLAMDVARRYARGAPEQEDLLQEGIIGLLRAAETYDPDLGFRFTTYATWWIRQSILRAVANTGRAIRLPVYRVDQLNALRRTTRRLRASNPELKITPKRLADELGWPAETVGELLVLDAQTFASIHPADDGGPSLLDQLVCAEPTPEDTAIQFDFEAFVADCLAALPDREADILRRRFGLHGKRSQTLEQIGKDYDLTRERIRQIESKGLRAFRRPSSKMIEHGRNFLDE